MKYVYTVKQNPLHKIRGVTFLGGLLKKLNN